MKTILAEYWKKSQTSVRDLLESVTQSIQDRFTSFISTIQFNLGYWFSQLYQQLPPTVQPTSPPTTHPDDCPAVLLPMCIGDRIYDDRGCVAGVKCRTGF